MNIHVDHKGTQMNTGSASEYKGVSFHVVE